MNINHQFNVCILLLTVAFWAFSNAHVVAQDSGASPLVITNVSTPNMVQVGEVIMLHACVRNNSRMAYNNHIVINYAITNFKWFSDSGRLSSDGQHDLGVTNLTAGESVCFDIPVLITNKHQRISADFILIWPGDIDDGNGLNFSDYFVGQPISIKPGRKNITHNSLIWGNNKQTDEKEMIQIFPNPTTKQIAVQTNGTEISLLTLYDASGRLIYRDTAPNKGLVVINIQHFVRGNYLLNMLVDGELYSKQVMVK